MTILRFEEMRDYPLLSLNPETHQGVFRVTMRTAKTIMVVELGSERGERRLKVIADDFCEYAYPGRRSEYAPFIAAFKQQEPT